MRRNEFVRIVAVGVVVIGLAVGACWFALQKRDCILTEVPVGILVTCPGKECGWLLLGDAFLAAEFGVDWDEQGLVERTRMGMPKRRYRAMASRAPTIYFPVPRSIQGLPDALIDIAIYSKRSGHGLSIHVSPSARTANVVYRHETDPSRPRVYEDGSVLF